MGRIGSNTLYHITLYCTPSNTPLFTSKTTIIQIILFPKKKRRRTNNDNPDNNRKSTAVKPGDKDYNGDKKNPDDSAAAGPKIELFFRLGEMFMIENPKSWLTYFYPSGGTSGGAED